MENLLSKPDFRLITSRSFKKTAFNSSLRILRFLFRLTFHTAYKNRTAELKKLVFTEIFLDKFYLWQLNWAKRAVWSTLLSNGLG